MLKRKICLLVNPYAGKGKTLRLLKKIENRLDQLPLHHHTIITSDIAETQELARTASSHGEYVAVLGGDGSARIVAEALMDHVGILAPLPGGRGNDFARMLGYPTDPVSACNILAYGKEIVIDMGVVNNHPFLTICSLGFDSVVNEYASKASIITGCFVYAYAGLRALPGWKAAQFTVTIDGKQFVHTGYTVAVANSRSYGGGMQIAPTASVRDELLEVVTLGDVPKRRILINIPRVYKGTHVNEPGFSIKRGYHIQVDCDSKYIAYADGDPVAQPPVSIKCIPNTLRVLVPDEIDINQY